ncbi:MAG: hypothetical protein ACKVQK_30630 [Burkholderiales bacterium]
MKLSPYFKDLSKSYAYEIEDLTYDSGGSNVLQSRLKVKRDQFTELLPMIEFEPVMVSPAFHRAFHFSDKALLEKLVASKPGALPQWKKLAASLKLEPWAEALAQKALKAEGGEEFMLITAGLEFILSGLGAEAAAGHAEPAPSEKTDSGEEKDADGDEVDDLGEAGEDYLNDQGFDRRN